MKSNDHPDHIANIKDQIKANASLLFPHATNRAPQDGYDIVIMTCSTASEGHRVYERSTLSPAHTQGPRYQAVLTYSGSVNPARKDLWAAKGPPADDLRAALEGLLRVTAAALEKYQGSVFRKEPGALEGVEGGVVDVAVIIGKKGR